MKLMEVKDPETSVAIEAKKQEAIELRRTEDINVKRVLSQLVHQVDDGLKNTGLSEGPVYDFISDSLQEWRMSSASSES